MGIYERSATEVICQIVFLDGLASLLFGLFLLSWKEIGEICGRLKGELSWYCEKIFNLVGLWNLMFVLVKLVI